MSNVSRSKRGIKTALIVRYETDGDTLIAVCENQNGERWYEVIKVKEEFSF